MMTHTTTIKKLNPVLISGGIFIISYFLFKVFEQKIPMIDLGLDMGLSDLLATISYSLGLLCVLTLTTLKNKKEMLILSVMIISLFSLPTLLSVAGPDSTIFSKPTQKRYNERIVIWKLEKSEEKPNKIY